MSNEKKKQLYDFIEASKKDGFDGFHKKITPFIENLNLTLDEANDLLSALAGIENRDDFYTQAHDDIYTAVDDYNRNYNEEDTMKDLIVEGR